MSRRPDPERLAAWRLLLEAHATVVDRLGRELEAETGLPLTWYDVLVQLNAAPQGRLRMRDLARAVLLSRSGLTRLVDRMETAGLVCREAHDSDGRGANALLTVAGRSALRRAAPVHLRGIDEHFARHLEAAEVAVLRTALDRVVSRGGDPDGPACETRQKPLT
ncbi:MAG TPA: MarR family transcriptional regulator [Candidatus Dormibacteraeota bacterium]|jgi:DNA-binding MarR family transcriptional regulator|nr:MarR family transcriptional regulator [Candidatus Dormibacteraeota bacterium]